MSKAYIALGSNLGDRHKNINDALCLLRSVGIEITKASKIAETDPVDGPPQNKYLNSVIKIDTSLSPYELLNELQKIENGLGRVRSVRNGPRTIDLDILLYDDIKMQTEKLTLPHPRMLQRDFVLIPLKEIEPDILNNKIFQHAKN